ncbi:MutS-related protein [Clostridium taeniosporum]|uniref:DNA mismatch repair protein MutS n=1 Tax=Clostridium taeniosporum TaxID=394958 RepID=A0A1D7XH33_9CLOT|nr:DNA mismatch repair protein MutS [Clostridium taeniosporum]AOR22657.1 DNA mismatch repair protein MutS [Clostridium taeniosporum]
MSKANEYYNSVLQENIKIKESLIKKLNIISIIRLIIIILMLIVDYLLYKADNYTAIIVSTITFLIVFIFTALNHSNKLRDKKISEILIDINQKGIDRINDDFKKFKDTGSEYLNYKHRFINDLNIFGSNSIFQLINSTVTIGGRNRLAEILSNEQSVSKKDILKRQEAIKELSSKVQWRQKFIISGLLNKSSNSDLNDLLVWGEGESKINILNVIISYIFIFINVVSVFLALSEVLPWSFVVLVFMIDFIVLKILTKSISKDIKLFNDIKKEINGYSEILELIENEEFNSEYLKELKNKISYKEISCKKEMKKLSNLAEWVGDSSYNAYYFIINILFFSDVFIMNGLEKWKKNNGSKLREWLNVMNEIDSLNSISNIAFDHEDWSYPNILNRSEVYGEEIGHPLIGNKAVKNNFSLSGVQKVALITGSNMSGKSTFLRSVGCNLALSYIGAPVYAKNFNCGIMSLYTCITTRDSLEESISSFYAEILRIKILIEACKKGEKVFFLLDEIFKGTNSRDRHTGATVLINQLIKHGGIGLVSTHDLELCDLEKEDNQIINYNFREFYENDKIKFDYILRRGKSETQNAINLMKLAGIDFI